MISAKYLETLKTKHEADPSWGSSGATYSKMVTDFAYAKKAMSLLDYGCGKMSMIEDLIEKGYTQFYDLYAYDPAIAGWSDAPENKCDVVTCTDVLEHIEPDCLPNVLLHIWELCGKGAFFAISTRPASHTLPDGRNAHLIVRDLDWWFGVLSGYFHIEQARMWGADTAVFYCSPWTHDLVEGLVNRFDFETDPEVKLNKGLAEIAGLDANVYEMPAKTVKVSGLWLKN